MKLDLEDAFEIKEIMVKLSIAIKILIDASTRMENLSPVIGEKWEWMECNLDQSMECIEETYVRLQHSLNDALDKALGDMEGGE